jgi:hypothetical protein
LFGAPGASIGASSGAVLGGVAGLDLFLPASMRPSVGHHKGPTMGPFCSAVTFAVVGIVSALFGCYAVGTLTLTCSHAQGEARCSRITTGWFDTAEISRQEFGPIARVEEGRTGQILVVTTGDQRQFIEGFDSAVFHRVRSVVDASESGMTVQTRSLAAWAPLLWGISAAAFLAAVLSLRKGVRMLRRELSATV